MNIDKGRAIQPELITHIHGKKKWLLMFAQLKIYNDCA